MVNWTSSSVKTLLLERHCQDGERATHRWRETIASHTADKDKLGLHKELSRLHEISSNKIYKCSKKLNRHFREGEIPMANKCIKRCSTRVAIRQMQITTTTRYPYSPTSVAKIKMTSHSYNVMGTMCRKYNSHTCTVLQAVLNSTTTLKKFGVFLRH